MKLSDQHLKVLKHLSGINPNVIIEKTTASNSQGTTVKTISMMRNILSSAFLKDFNVKSDIKIWDLDQFIKVYKSLSNPDIVKVDDNHIHIKSDDVFVKYQMSKLPNMTTPTKDVNMPNKDNYLFKLSKNLISNIPKLASKCCLPDLLFQADGKTLKCIILDKGKYSETDTQFEFEICDMKHKFSAFLKIENFKLLEDDYEVRISSKMISEFVSLKNDVTTYIALEEASVFNQSEIWKKKINSQKEIDDKMEKLHTAYMKKRNKLESLKRH